MLIRGLCIQLYALNIYVWIYYSLQVLLLTFWIHMMRRVRRGCVCVHARERERIPFISVFLDFSLFCCKLVKLISSNSDIPRGIFQKNEREQWTCKVLLSDRRLSFSNRVGRLSNTYTIRDNYTNMDSFIDKGCMALFFFWNQTRTMSTKKLFKPWVRFSLQI